MDDRTRLLSHSDPIHPEYIHRAERPEQDKVCCTWWLWPIVIGIFVIAAGLPAAMLTAGPITKHVCTITDCWCDIHSFQPACRVNGTICTPTYLALLIGDLMLHYKDHSTYVTYEKYRYIDNPTTKCTCDMLAPTGQITCRKFYSTLAIGSSDYGDMYGYYILYVMAAVVVYILGVSCNLAMVLFLRKHCMDNE